MIFKGLKRFHRVTIKDEQKRDTLLNTEPSLNPDCKFPHPTNPLIKVLFKKWKIPTQNQQETMASATNGKF